MLGEEEPTRRNLAYTIRHTVRQSDGSYNRYDEAYFGSVKFRALRRGVKQIEDSLLGDAEVLRFLLLETVAEDTRVGEVLPDVEARRKPVRSKMKRILLCEQRVLTPGRKVRVVLLSSRMRVAKNRHEWYTVGT